MENNNEVLREIYKQILRQNELQERTRRNASKLVWWFAGIWLVGLALAIVFLMTIGAFGYFVNL